MLRSLRRHMGVARTIAFIAATTPSVAIGQVIYDNGLPLGNGGLAVSGPFRSANDFPISSPATLGSFDWYVIRPLVNGQPAVVSNFFWSVFTDAAGSPGSTELGSGVVSGAVGTLFSNPGNYDIYGFNVSMGGLSLDAGTYWLSIGGYTDTHDAGLGFWSTSMYSGNERASENGGPWLNYGMEGAFTIYGTEATTTPEPASLALLATGLVGFLGAARRQRKSRRIA